MDDLRERLEVILRNEDLIEWDCWPEVSATLREALAHPERLMGEPVATVLTSDPYDERSGPWYSAADVKKLEALPAGTKLYAPEVKP